MKNIDAWIKSLFSTIDDMDAGKFVNYFTQNGSFYFGNAEPVKNQENIKESVGQFFKTIKGLSHQISDYWQDENVIICEGRVTYNKLDGNDLSLPFTNIFRLEDDLINDYRIYMDISPLYSS